MILFHVAPRSARGSISEHGLEAACPSRWRLQRVDPQTAVFLWETIEAARAWRDCPDLRFDQRDHDIWQVDAADLYVCADLMSEVDRRFSSSCVVFDDVGPDLVRVAEVSDRDAVR